MRRLMALVSAGLLVASLAGSATATGATTRSSSFVGNFALLDGASGQAGELLGELSAKMSVPTDSKLVSGSFDFNGSPGNPLLNLTGRSRSPGSTTTPTTNPTGARSRVRLSPTASTPHATTAVRTTPHARWAPCGSLTASIRPCATRSPSGTPRMQQADGSRSTGSWSATAPSSSTLHPAADPAGTSSGPS